MNKEVKFEINGLDIFPEKARKSELIFYEFQPGDSTKYEIGIGENVVPLFCNVDSDDYKEYLYIVFRTGCYHFHKNEFENEIKDGFIKYFAEKINVNLYTAKILIDFIRFIPAINAKLKLLGYEWKYI